MILVNQPATILGKNIIAENTMEVTFAISGSEFSFKAGQYVTVCIPSLKGSRTPDRCHDFSIASSPTNSKEMSIAFRMSQSIFKSALLDVPIGAVVNIDGPKGVLTLPITSNVNGQMSNVPPVIFIAGGIGITPMISMIRYATEIKSPQKITLLYFNTTVEKTAYREELLTLCKINKHFVFREIQGEPSKEYFAEHISDESHTLWYVAGPPKMVTLTRNILSVSGILIKQIKFEEFSGYER